MRTFRTFLLGAGGFVGIISLVISAASGISNYHYRHIEQTINLLELNGDKHARRIGDVMSLEYLSKDIRVPLCPFRFCLIREAEEFPNIDLYFEEDEGANQTIKPLVNKDFSASLIKGGDMRKVTIRKSNLSNISWADVNLSESSFVESRLPCAKFSSVNFTNARFDDSDFAGAQISNSDFQGAIFFDSDLTGMRFFNTNISNTVFVWTKDKPKMDPDTLRGAWAFRGQEPQFLVRSNVPYQRAEQLKTYRMCSPDDASAESGAHLSMPCLRDYQSQENLSKIETKSWTKWCAVRASWYAGLFTQMKSYFK